MYQYHNSWPSFQLCFLASPPTFNTKTSTKKKTSPTDDFWDLLNPPGFKPRVVFHRRWSLLAAFSRVKVAWAACCLRIASPIWDEVGSFCCALTCHWLRQFWQKNPARCHGCVCVTWKNRADLLTVFEYNLKRLKFWGRSILRSSVMNRMSSIKYQTICIGLKKRQGHPACRTCCDSPRQDDAIHFYAEVGFFRETIYQKGWFFWFVRIWLWYFWLGQ